MNNFALAFVHFLVFSSVSHNEERLVTYLLFDCYHAHFCQNKVVCFDVNVVLFLLIVMIALTQLECHSMLFTINSPTHTVTLGKQSSCLAHALALGIVANGISVFTYTFVPM